MAWGGGDGQIGEVSGMDGAEGTPAGKKPACPAPWPGRYHFRDCGGSHRGVRTSPVGRARIRGPWSQPQVGLPTPRSQRQVEILGISHGNLHPVRDQLQVSPLLRLALPSDHPHGTGMEGLEWKSNLKVKGP